MSSEEYVTNTGGLFASEQASPYIADRPYPLASKVSHISTATLLASIVPPEVPSIWKSIVEDDVEKKFTRLAKTWKAQTAHLSNVTMKCIHPAYQRIIGMGERVVLLILNDLKRTRSDWFWALTAITGDNPISEQDAGHVDRMTEAWLQWGRDQGYDV